MGHRTPGDNRRMALLSLSNAHLAFGHVALLDNAAFSLEAGERRGGREPADHQHGSVIEHPRRLQLALEGGVGGQGHEAQGAGHDA